MLGLEETSLSYKLCFFVAVAASLFSIGTVFTAGFINLFFMVGVIGFVSSIGLEYMICNITSDDERKVFEKFLKYFFVFLALAVILLPSFANGNATNPGFVVIKRGDSKRVIFNQSLTIPYLDEVYMEVSSLRWENQVAVGDDGKPTIYFRLRFEPNQNKDLVRELVRKYDSEKRIREEIKKLVTSKLDTL